MKFHFDNWRKFLTEVQISVFHGSPTKFSGFDLSRTKEFGFHFGLDPKQAAHRINNNGFIYEVLVIYRHPIEMPDFGRWTLRDIAGELGTPEDEIKKFEILAAERAKDSGGSMRVEQNLLTAELLKEAGHDAIIYENRGEDGGQSLIVWDPSRIIIKEIKKL
jgi:hypothetical protein